MSIHISVVVIKFLDMVVILVVKLVILKCIICLNDNLSSNTSNECISFRVVSSYFEFSYSQTFKIVLLDLKWHTVAEQREQAVHGTPDQI